MWKETEDLPVAVTKYGGVIFVVHKPEEDVSSKVPAKVSYAQVNNIKRLVEDADKPQASHRKCQVNNFCDNPVTIQRQDGKWVCKEHV